MGNRHQLAAALDYAREGDMVVVIKLDCLARSVTDLLNIVRPLETKNVDVRVLSMSGAQALDTAQRLGNSCWG